MKSNSRRTILIAAAVFLVLLALYLGLRFGNRQAEEKEEAREEAEKIRLVTAEDLSAMGYTEGDDSMSYTNEDGTWILDSDPEIALQQIELTTMADDLKDLTADRELEDPDPLKDYGLTEPSYSIWYTADGDTSTIYIGDAADDDYYATVDDTGKVYTIPGDILLDMHFDLVEIAELDQVPAIGSGNLLKVDVTRPGGETSVYTDEDDLSQLAGGFGALTLSTVENYHVDSEEQWTEYGLDPENRTTVTASYTDNDTGEEASFTVYVGNKGTNSDGEYYYLTVEGSQIVYRVSESVADNLMTVDETEEESEETEEESEEQSEEQTEG